MIRLRITTITRVRDGKLPLKYAGNDLILLRANNDFARPKYGLYRKIAKELKDEVLRFADFDLIEISSK